MDPNANLKMIREILDDRSNNGGELDIDDWDQLAELINALDGWMSNGGFTPMDWKKGERK